uniref:Immunoglobulin subtype domain-containing protein n=1 Tax=Sinocyclocheilus anshuiensis TaxID=1608454 RepID=A0A671SDZ2_9TELE
VNTLICPCSCSSGVFGAKTNEIQSMPVMEGDTVLLHNDFTEICENDHLLWNIRNETSLLAKINKKKQFLPTSDVLDGRFRDRLKLDNQTGSLIITNTTPQHAGLYEVKIIGARSSSKTFSVSVYARLPVPVISSNSSQCSSSSSSSSQQNCSLVCSVVNVSDVTLSCISLSLPLETQHLDITQLCHTYAVLMCCICRKLTETDREGKCYLQLLNKKLHSKYFNQLIAVAQFVVTGRRRREPVNT